MFCAEILSENILQTNMIDRIKFYIRDVEVERVEKSLGLVDREIGSDGSSLFFGRIKNLRVKYAGTRLQIEGSLHKYAKGNNYGLFTYEEAKAAVRELSDLTGLRLEDFIVSQIELGLNIPMEEAPQKYLDILHSYQGKSFIPMSPLKKTSKLMGCRCKLSEYEIKFYDKTFEAIHDGRIKVSERGKVPANILRYELTLSRKQLINEGFNNVTGANLQSKLHYIKFKKLMKRVFDKIEISDISLDYSKMLQNEIKKYIFVMSDGYNRYLSYLKEYCGEEEYRKEQRSKNILLKKIAPLKIGKLETELKSKFTEAISKI